VHGSQDDVVPPSMSRNYQVRAAERGDRATFVPVEGAAHRDVIAADGPAWAVAMDELEALLA